jgi:hypothetical protein
MREDVLGVETPPEWHHIDDMKFANPPNHGQHELFLSDHLTHPYWDLISRRFSFC